MLYDPRVLLPYSHLGETNELCVQDISSFAVEGETLTFWQLQVHGRLFLDLHELFLMNNCDGQWAWPGKMLFELGLNPAGFLGVVSQSRFHKRM